MTTVIGLGDSVTYGVGDAGASFVGPSWSGRLAHGIGAREYRNFAFPGAQSRDLLRLQVPTALRHRPDVVLLSIGGNDALRSTFDEDRLCREVSESVRMLAESGAHVVLLGMADPDRTLPAPKRLRSLLSRRMARVNSALAHAVTGCGAEILATWDDPNAYDVRRWHVDRLHPSPLGYQYLAERAMDLLGLASVVEPLPTRVCGPSTTRWMLRHASVWLAKRSVDLVPGLVAMAVRERAAPPAPLSASRGAR